MGQRCSPPEHRYTPVELWLHTVTHGRGSEGETGERSGEPVPFTLPRNMVYRAFLPLMRTPRLPVVDWTDTPPADLNGLVRFAGRRILVSARVPSHSNAVYMSERLRAVVTTKTTLWSSIWRMTAIYNSLLMNVLDLTIRFQVKRNHVIVINCEVHETWQQLATLRVRQCCKTNPQHKKTGIVSNATLRRFR